MSSDGEEAEAWRRTLDGTERRVHHQEERRGDANLVDSAHSCGSVRDRAADCSAGGVTSSGRTVTSDRHESGGEAGPASKNLQR